MFGLSIQYTFIDNNPYPAKLISLYFQPLAIHLLKMLEITHVYFNLRSNIYRY